MKTKNFKIEFKEDSKRDGEREREKPRKLYMELWIRDLQRERERGFGILEKGKRKRRVGIAEIEMRVFVF